MPKPRTILSLLAIGRMAAVLGTIALTQAVAGELVPTPEASTENGHERSPAEPAKDTIDSRSLGLICDGRTDNASVFDLIHLKASASSGQIVTFHPRPIHA